MRFGFVVTYQDGRKVTEFQTDWLSIPNEPIQKVQLFDSATNEYMLELSDFDTFYFSNESITVPSYGVPFPGHLVAKLFGGIKDNSATQYRVGLIGEPSIKVEQLPVTNVKVAPQVMKPGVPA